MIGYHAAKTAEGLARSAGASEDAAKAAGIATATTTVITHQDLGGLAYLAEQAIRMEVAERSSNNSRQKG